MKPRIRVMKARWTAGTCALCGGGPILRGQRITRLDDGRWVHLGCAPTIQAARREPA